MCLLENLNLNLFFPLLSDYKNLQGFGVLSIEKEKKEKGKMLDFGVQSGPKVTCTGPNNDKDPYLILKSDMIFMGHPTMHMEFWYDAQLHMVSLKIKNQLPPLARCQSYDDDDDDGS